MAERTIYIVSHGKTYKTNKTNVTRLWEVFECEWGKQELEIAWQKNEKDEYYETTPARKHKIKKLCQDAVGNKIYIYPVGEFYEDGMAIWQDVIGGRD
jgi:hypothetical protein